MKTRIVKVLAFLIIIASLCLSACDKADIRKEAVGDESSTSSIKVEILMEDASEITDREDEHSNNAESSYAYSNNVHNNSDHDEEAANEELRSDEAADGQTIAEEGNNVMGMQGESMTSNNNKRAATQEEFYISEIDDEIFARIYGKSYKENCSLPREDLRYLHLTYVNFQGENSEGEMIVNVHIAEDVLDIFRQLYEAGYPIEKIRLVDEYDADDESSMADNNSSAFNFRFISYTTTVSKHGLGMAIDINPLYNPYVKEVDGRLSVEPANASDYVDRDSDFAHKIDGNDLAYRLFTAKGFEWGGAWKNSKDYQHFELPSKKIRQFYPDYGR